VVAPVFLDDQIEGYPEGAPRVVHARKPGGFLQGVTPPPVASLLLDFVVRLGQLGSALPSGVPVVVVVASEGAERIGAVDGRIIVVVVVVGIVPARGRGVRRRGAVRGDAAQAADVVALSLDPSPLLLDPVGHTKGRGKIRIDRAAAAAQPLTGASNGVPRPGAAPGGRRVNGGRIEPSYSSAAAVSEAARSVRDPSSSSQRRRRRRCCRPLVVVVVVVREAAASEPSRRSTEGTRLVGASGASNGGGVLRVVVQRGGNALVVPSQVPFSQLPTDVGPIVGIGTGRTRTPHGHGLGHSFFHFYRLFFALPSQSFSLPCFSIVSEDVCVFENISRKSCLSACLVASRLETDASRLILLLDSLRRRSSEKVSRRLLAFRFYG